MLMSPDSSNRILILPLVVLLISATTAFGQSRQQLILEQSSNPVARHWIGVLAEPVGDALQKQLAIETGLLVERVVPESPAAEAGIQRHDVLLTFGETALGRVEDLAGAIAKTGETEQKIELVREGKRFDVQVTPARRPQEQVDLNVSPQERERVFRWLREFDNRRKPVRLQLIRPGFTLPEGTIEEAEGRLNLPENMSIIIKKKGDQPADIQVTREDDSWHVTEDKLDELPEDVRNHVQSMLGGSGKTLELRSEHLRKALPSASDELRKQIEQWWQDPPRGPGSGVRRLRIGPEQLNRDLDETVEEMRIQLDRLKKQIDSMRDQQRSKDKADNPSDRDASSTK